MSLVYAPLFVFGCGWHGLTLGPAGPCGDSWVGRAWLGYVQMEPIYHDAPVWLQLVNELDMFFFSWFYVLSVIVFVSKRQDRSEEHTSELQSLMRISYAVFCLNKKN